MIVADVMYQPGRENYQKVAAPGGRHASFQKMGPDIPMAWTVTIDLSDAEHQALYDWIQENRRTLYLERLIALLYPDT